MTSHIYILTDGVNTKIGITTDLVKRMASYNTHNATIQLVKKYPCAEDEAKRVETAIKNIFKNQLTGKSKEWFSVGADVVDRFVSNLLEKPLTSNVLPSLHGAKLTDEAWELKEEISKPVVARGKTDYQLRQKFAENRMWSRRRLLITTFRCLTTTMCGDSSTWFLLPVGITWRFAQPRSQCPILNV